MAEEGLDVCFVIRVCFRRDATSINSQKKLLEKKNNGRRLIGPSRPVVMTTSTSMTTQSV